MTRRHVFPGRDTRVQMFPLHHITNVLAIYKDKRMVTPASSKTTKMTLTLTNGARVRVTTYI